MTQSSCISLLLLLTASPLLSQTRTLIVRHVGVVDVAAGRLNTDQTVVIRGGRIAEIGPAAKVIVPGDSEVLEALGKFLIPGLADMHNHLTNPVGPPEDAVRFLANLLPWGVTTVFSPSLALEDFRRAKEASSGQ